MAHKRLPVPTAPQSSSSAGSSSSDAGDEEDSVSGSPRDSPAAEKPLGEAPESEVVATPLPTTVMNDEASSSSAPETEGEGPSNVITTTPSHDQTKPAAESSVSESDSDSDSDSDPPRSRPNTRSANPGVKPIISKPMVTKDAAKPKKETPSKRAAEPISSHDDPPRKQPFQRLWTEEDEIRILKAVFDFSKKVPDPFVDQRRLCEFVKKSVHMSCTNSQLMDKIRRLKKKYENNSRRGKKGKDPEFFKPHDKLAYDLSKKIWDKGPLRVTGQEKKVNGLANDSSALVRKGTALREKREKEGRSVHAAEINVGKEILSPEEIGNGLLEICTTERSICQTLMKKAYTFLETSKAREVEAKWKELLIMEMEHHIKRADFSKQLFQTMLDALRRSRGHS